ncbi:hypothetical protein EV141_1452 [Microcella putealis]|uniref:Uncharacterized protein n=1 Tax=Microcella putealis TaxID=337005 RepID=A0A4Q7LTS6_9MICO|nr:hypothetical protein [Microcella putealis]RZS57733.1 hypothetical protein EV141_1452 [Microcella putealis]TQM24800.1 hypothetical protein BJ957_1061 [Microcella putealis]
MAIHTPKTREELAGHLSPKRLTAEVFERAVSAGAAESRTYSKGAPKSAPNMTRWFRTVEFMHDELMLLKLDWKRSDPQNLPYFSQADLNLGLIASSGDEFTGVAWGTPSTKNPKGSAFAKRVDENGQGALFAQQTADGGGIDVKYLWILLYNERDGMVYLELSRPKSMAGKQIDSWLDRIIFPPFDLALGAFTFEETEADDESFGFTIARR